MADVLKPIKLIAWDENAMGYFWRTDGMLCKCSSVFNMRGLSLMK
jgi:hypothetical protein